MPCYSPVRGVLSVAPGGRRSLSFGASASGQGMSFPCGRCIGCRLERARQWAVRIVHESKMHDANSFLTLTYDDSNLPLDRSLSVSHCQLFLKRLRARLDPIRIRFFLCGEYGERLGRPHYHAIVFGWFPGDAVLIKGSGELSLFSSRLLSDTWGHGFASVGSVSFDSAAYVANYATKKVIGEAAAAHYQGRKPEFLLMSRRPGIGFSWLEKFHGDVYPSDEVIIRGASCRPPRYYDQVVERSDPVGIALLKLKRIDEAVKLEEVLSCGRAILVDESRNAVRLRVRETVAKAKLSLKRRTLENP